MSTEHQPRTSWAWLAAMSEVTAERDAAVAAIERVLAVLEGTVPVGWVGMSAEMLALSIAHALDGDA